MLCLQAAIIALQLAAQVGFMMERTKNNMFGELANAETTPVDPFFAAFLTTQVERGAVQLHYGLTVSVL